MSRSDRNDEPEDGMDFIDAAFDAELAGLFEASGPPDTDPAFTARVMEKAGRTGRYRFLALGAAGALGAVIAGSQLTRLSDGFASQISGAPGEAAGLVSAETLLALALAGIALVFSRVLNGGRAV
ncbi:MAG: hypothetical protein ACOC20_05995 [Oceanicaulis sp.]